VLGEGVVRVSDCEVCGNSGVSTRRAATQGTTVEACKRCIDRMGMTELDRPNPTQRPHVGPKKYGKKSGGYSGMGRTGRDIMIKNEKELISDFSKAIQSSRRKSGLEQKALAAKIGERLNVIQRVERGIRPTDTILKKLEKELGIELMVDRVADNSRTLSKKEDRPMTLADLLDEQLRKE
jgi:uncharacterized protein (TIGR00270 family)